MISAFARVSYIFGVRAYPALKKNEVCSRKMHKSRIVLALFLPRDLNERCIESASRLLHFCHARIGRLHTFVEYSLSGYGPRLMAGAQTTWLCCRIN